MDSIKHYSIPEDDERTELREGVIRALRAVPIYFKSSINIDGISATDLFSINSLLGGTIEEQTVATLNEIRNVWDAEKKWAEYSFKRYAESFPDVRLEREGDKKPLIGIELKGWYLLAKEEEPSFRFKASVDAMTEWDLITVFPWSLSNVISGTPVLEAPYIEQGKYVADLRTYYWEHRNSNAKPVKHPKTHPYPEPGSKYSDTVVNDSSGNFGRIGRVKGLMDDWIAETMQTPLVGIEARWWVKFLKMFDERGDEKAILAKFERLAKKTKHDSAWAEEAFNYVKQLMNM